jgi:hypothetical protein
MYLASQKFGRKEKNGTWLLLACLSSDLFCGGGQMILQGRKYQHGTTEVVALESADTGRVKVAPIVPPFLGMSYLARVGSLKPLPQKYLQGGLPG